jgi:hypothetical protein
MLHEPKSAAKAVKERKQRAAAQLQQPATEQQLPARKQAKRKIAATAEAVVTGGKARKTGTVLARAQLPYSTAGTIIGAGAVADRQTTLLGKSTYRESEKVAREGAVGSMATDKMPRMRDACTEEEREETRKKMRVWKKENLAPERSL